MACGSGKVEFFFLLALFGLLCWSGNAQTVLQEDDGDKDSGKSIREEYLQYNEEDEGDAEQTDPGVIARNPRMPTQTLLLEVADADERSNLVEGLTGEMKAVMTCLTDWSAVQSEMRKVWRVPDFALVKQDVGNVTFLLDQALPFCGLRTKEISLFINGSVDPTPGGEYHGKAAAFLTNAHFKLGRDYFATDEYCISGVTAKRIHVRYCEPECSTVRPCVPKCFAPGEAMSLYPLKAPMSSGSVEYRPKFYDMDGPVSEPETIMPHFRQMRPKTHLVCDPSTPLMMTPYSEQMATMMRRMLRQNIRSMKFRMIVDGRLLYYTLDDHNCPEMRELEAGSYCVDGLQNVGIVAQYNNTEEEGVIFTCALPSPGPVVSMLVGVGMLASSIFLLIILIVYGLLWQQQNIHGWTVVGHTASMFFTYIFVGLAHIMRIKYVHLVGTRICYAIGVLGHFFFLSTFCWLTLISFDLWWTFKSITPSKNTQGYRLASYFAIGWGAPLIFVGSSVALDLIIGNECTSLRLPKYGQNTCYITESSQGLYFYYPAAATLMCNFLFFVVTLYKLYHYKQRASAVSKKEQTNNKLMVLFSKLFFVMGITWIFEFISWLHVGVWVNWFWAIFDIINVLQAFAIFVIYVCKQDIVESLEKKYPQLSKWIRKKVFVCIRRHPSSDMMDSMGRSASSAGPRDHGGRKDKTKVTNCPPEGSP